MHLTEMLFAFLCIGGGWSTRSMSIRCCSQNDLFHVDRIIVDTIEDSFASLQNNEENEYMQIVGNLGVI